MTEWEYYTLTEKLITDQQNYFSFNMLQGEGWELISCTTLKASPDSLISWTFKRKKNSYVVKVEQIL